MVFLLVLVLVTATCAEVVRSAGTADLSLAAQAYFQTATAEFLFALRAHK